MGEPNEQHDNDNMITAMRIKKQIDNYRSIMPNADSNNVAVRFSK